MPAEKKTVTYRSEGCSSDSADALLSRNVLDQRAQIHFDKGQNYVHPKITIWKPKWVENSLTRKKNVPVEVMEFKLYW